MRRMEVAEITDLAVLQKACKRLGGDLDMTVKEALFYAKQKKVCDGAITFPECVYQIAVIKNDAGKYEIQADLYEPKLREIVGNEAGILSQMYQIEKHRKIARDRGYEIIGEKVNSQNGNIELLIKP